jgi:CMP-N-acetylneuraminic acid synthetase
MTCSVIIPAQKHNKYHKMGDLAPFGDTTLLEWKISQCKEFIQPECIYVSTDDDSIARDMISLYFRSTYDV